MCQLNNPEMIMSKVFLTDLNQLFPKPSERLRSGNAVLVLVSDSFSVEITFSVNWLSYYEAKNISPCLYLIFQFEDPIFDMYFLFLNVFQFFGQLRIISSDNI